MNNLPDPRLCRMVLHAYVGEDEHGTGIFGIKQGFTPCGLIPLVASVEGKMPQQWLIDQMRGMSDQSGKRIYLVRFVFDAVELEIGK